jgi:cysteine sulfinate desulfinase/cysteine desulfurase-like protein
MLLKYVGLSSQPTCFLIPYLQALGKLPVSVQDLGVDALTVVGHKFYGPRIGALYVRNLGKEGGLLLDPLFQGGGQVEPMWRQLPSVSFRCLFRSVAIALALRTRQ